MSIFDKMPNQHEIDPENSCERGCIESMVFIVAADGTFEPGEVVDFHKAIKHNPRLNSLHYGFAEDLFTRSGTAIVSEGIDARLPKVLEMLPTKEDRLEAMKMVLYICHYKKEINEDEKLLLEKIQNRYEIQDDEIKPFMREIGLVI